MSEQVIELAERQRPRSAEEVLAPIKERIDQARRDRRRYEPTWHSNRAFASGKHWLRWSRPDRRLMLDPRDVEGGRERVSADLLTQYLQTASGQLQGFDERPNLLFNRDDIPSEDFTEAANDALAFGWDSEWQAKRVLSRTRRRMIVDGTAAVRVRFDPTVGRELGQVPLGPDGQPILDREQARAFVAEMQAAGERVRFKNLREGRVLWEPLSVFNLLVPPGIEDEEEFAWEAVIRAVPLDKLRQHYGEAKVEGLQEEPLAALEMLGVKELAESSIGASEEDYGQPGKLDGYAALINYFERPCREYPKGREVVFAGERLLETKDTLPVKRPSGDYGSGISYFHYWHVEGRFWGRALIEAGKSTQRLYNKRLQQENDTIDRGQPYTIAHKGAELEVPREIMQIVRYDQGQTPTHVQGIGPGEWMWRAKQGIIDDLEREMGIPASELGENPANVQTYAQLALLSERARQKVAPIVEEAQGNVARLVEFTVPLIRRYWPSDKLIALAGEEDMAEAVQFQASKLPEFFLCRVAEGSTKPRDQGAQIQLVMDLWNADQQQPEQMRRLDLDWLHGSLEAGKPLDIPARPTDVHLEKARWQNGLLADRQPVKAAPYDPPEVHIPVHTELRVEAEMAGDQELLALIDAHLAEDEQIQAQQQAAQAQAEREQALEQAEIQQASRRPPAQT